MNNSVRWEQVPAQLFLPSNSVHVWSARLDQPESIFEQLQSSLSKDERIHADKFVFDRDRQHFVVARGVLRNILGAYLDVAPGVVQFSYEPTGKPFLASSSAINPLQFNLSHAHGLAVYAFTQHTEVGIDVEYIRPIPDCDRIAAQNFSQQERIIFSALPIDEKIPAFFRIWTRKEAFIKALGDGLTFPLNQFSVVPESGETTDLVTVDDHSTRVSQWLLGSFVPEPNYIAALATQSRFAQISFWSWKDNSEFLGHVS